MPETAPWDAPAPAGDDTPPWGAQPGPEREGGLMQTVPEAIGMLGTSEGRSRLMQNLPPTSMADMAASMLTPQGRSRLYNTQIQPILDMFKSVKTVESGKATDDEEGELAFNVAQMFIGGGEAIPAVLHEAIKPVAPIAKAFNDTVAAPAAQRLDSSVRAEDPNGAQPMLQEAHQLGVIGMNAPENINLARLAEREKDTPAEAAFRAVPPQTLGAARTPESMLSPMGHAPGSYDARGKEWVSKIDSPESAQQAIEQIAQSHDWFPESRAGTPSLASRQAMAEAAGVDASEFNSQYFAEHFDNDGKVRAAIQATRQATQDFTAAAEKNRLEPSDENAAAQLEAEKRQEHILEYTLGKRAETGRSLNAWKELLREQETGKATTKLKVGEQSGEVPQGTADLIGAAREVQSNLAKPGKGPVGLGKLVKTAEDLVNAHDEVPKTRTRLTDVAKRARVAAKEAQAGNKPTGLDALIAEAGELAKTLPRGPEEIGKPEPQGLASMISEAQRATRETGAPGAASKLISLAEQAEKLAMTMPRTPEEAAAKMPADLASLVASARDTLRKVKGARGTTGLDQLIKNAETQAKNMIAQKAVRAPIDALPPELKGLVERAERVTKRFGGIAKGEEAAFLLAQSGRTAAEQADLARSVEGMNANQVARVLEKLRNVKDPHWTFAIVQQSLISGLVTHTFYPIINAMQSVLDRVIAPEFAAMTMKATGHEKSLVAPLHAGVALVRSFPDSLAGAVQAFKTGARVPLESEMRLAERGLPSPQAKGAQTPYQQNGMRINWGTFKPENFWGRVLGTTPEGLAKAARTLSIPGRFANSQHTFFKIANERASLSAAAYEKAAGEAKAGTPDFWNKYQYHIDNPTDEALSNAVTDGYSGTFMDKLGKLSDRAASLVRDTPARWVIFFTHIPFKIVQRGIENSPVAMLHMLSETKTGMALKGELGADAQHLSWAHVALGTAFAGYVMNKALGGQVTGDFPNDPKERARWQALGIQPNSVEIAGQWISLTRFGSLGLSARMAANWAHVAQHYENDPKDTLMHAGFALGLGTANAMLGDVGLETVKGFVDVLEDREKAEQFAAYHIASIAQPVSMLSQAASFTDPYMRQANTLLQGLMERLPVLREMLPAKRDPIFGEPVPNPGYHTILRESPVSHDPIKAEMDRIGYFPTRPQRTIGGVRLDDTQYERYEATAGPAVKQGLSALMRGPAYQRASGVAQTAMVKGTVSYFRAKARAALQLDKHHLIQQGVAQRKQAILGH